MEIGKEYTRHDDENNKINFPFQEEIGEFTGYSKHGWLNFKLSGGKSCSMNGGNYEEYLGRDRKI